MNPVAATGVVVGGAALCLSVIGVARVSSVMLTGSGPVALAAVVSASAEARGDNAGTAHSDWPVLAGERA